MPTTDVTETPVWNIRRESSHDEYLASLSAQADSSHRIPLFKMPPKVRSRLYPLVLVLAARERKGTDAIRCDTEESSVTSNTISRSFGLNPMNAKKPQLHFGFTAGRMPSWG